MKRDYFWIVAGLALVAAPLAGCARHSVALAKPEPPAVIDKIDGSEFSRLTLTDGAMKRIDVRTAKVSESPSKDKDSKQLAVPYSALLYDPTGKTWVYTNPQPRIFVRQLIEVDYIKGDTVYLVKGPPVGTDVATMGVAELYGTELKVGH